MTETQQDREDIVRSAVWKTLEDMRYRVLRLTTLFKDTPIMDKATDLLKVMKDKQEELKPNEG